MFSSDNGHHDEGGHDTDRFDPNGPLRGMKRDLYEGGIRVPMIARWPGTISPGRISDHIAYFGDLMATAAELADAKTPPHVDSISFVPTLRGEGQQRSHEYLYWEFYEQGSKQAVRFGPWKAVRQPMLTGPIELFNLDIDLGEATRRCRGQSKTGRPGRGDDEGSPYAQHELDHSRKRESEAT